MFTLQAGLGSGALRRVFSVRLIGDDIRHAPRDWENYPDFPRLSDQLPAGVQKDYELFTVIWPASRA